MRYCNKCGEILSDDSLMCPACEVETVKMGCFGEQAELFPASETERIESLYTYHKDTLRQAAAAVTKAEIALKKKIAEREMAAEMLIAYDQMIKSRGISDDPSEAPCEAADSPSGDVDLSDSEASQTVEREPIWHDSDSENDAEEEDEEEIVPFGDGEDWRF